MKRLLAVVTLWAICVAGSVLAEPVVRQITVTGAGRIEAVPDMATITLGVTNEAPEAGDAMAATSGAVERVLGRLKEMGIAPRDMQTRNLSLNPVWSNRASSRTGTPKISGFVASNTVLVRVRDMDGLGRILDAVISDGANNFNGLQFSVQEPEPLVIQARQAAVADAVAKAQILAEAAGVTLGQVITMTEHGGGERPMRMEMAAARSGGVPIAAGEVSLGASVSMVFAIAE